MLLRVSAALACLAVGAAHGATAPEAKAPAEPAVRRSVSEDDNVRIEELRVRGQTQSITVKSKIPGVAAYEIVPASAARDPSQVGDDSGRRLWRFLAF